MTGDTLLLRQVHPSWVNDGQPTSQAFRPTPKDEHKLSVYDGDLISADDAWAHYTSKLGNRSAGVVGVTVAECHGCSLVVTPDPEAFPEHALIDFAALPKREVYRRAKRLSDHAERRGWLYQPDDSTP